MFQVNKSSSDFWNRINLIWQECIELPSWYFILSVAELDGKVYVAYRDHKYAHAEPLMYDSTKDQWSSLPALPYANFSLVTVPDKMELLAIGGDVNNNGVMEVTNKVFLWDKLNRKWTTPYPNMPTARSYCSSISHGSTVIVAGGVTHWDPWTMTRAVELLYIKEDGWFSKSHWSVVEQLPHVVYRAIPLIVENKLYIALGSDKNDGTSICNIVAASLPELLQSNNKNTSSSQVWYKLADVPYSSFSINHYHGCLITFGGCHRTERSNKEKLGWEIVPLIHIYNHYTNTWDCVGEIPYKYSIGRSVHIRSDKIFFIGGLTGTCNGGKVDDIVTTCFLLTLSPL